MKKHLKISLLTLLLVCTVQLISAQKELAIDYVNPLIGTPEAGFKDGLEGVRLKEPFITYTQIINGVNLIFEMGKRPNFNALQPDR